MSISVVKIFTINPTIVMRFGANHIGNLLTNQFHHGCKYLSGNHMFCIFLIIIIIIKNLYIFSSFSYMYHVFIFTRFLFHFNIHHSGFIIIYYFCIYVYTRIVIDHAILYYYFIYIFMYYFLCIILCCVS